LALHAEYSTKVDPVQPAQSPGDGGGARVPLSSTHIRTFSPSEPCEVVGYVGGSLFTVKKPLKGGQPPGGGKRSAIKEFSRASRRRFQLMVAKIEKAALPVFLTLTYPDIFPEDHAEWYRDFQRLRARMKRKGWCGIWRREIKLRQSGVNVGKAAPHYHILVWGASVDEIMAYIPKAWHKIAGGGDPNHLKFMLGELPGSKPCAEQVRTWSGVVSYVGKYMAKIEDVSELGVLPGRFWGVINSARIPWAAAISLSVPYSVAYTFFRYIRRLLRMRGRSSWSSSSAYVNDPWRWLEAVNQHLLS
jgi:hypothetical protein